MLKLNPFFSTTLEFQVTQVEKVPENHYDCKNWEQGPGVYYIEENNCFYFVGKYSVDVIYGADEKGFFKVVENTYESPKVDEDLFLKSIAAMNGHRL